MADAAPAKAAPADDRLKLIKAKTAKARTEKAQFQTAFQEAFKFGLPWRIAPGRASSSPNLSDANDNFTSLGSMLSPDFASMISDTFWPEHDRWAYQEPTADVPEAFADQFKAYLETTTNLIFSTIAASRFYEESKVAAQDLSVSAAGLIIEDRGGFQPIHCQAIPINELLISRGPNGTIDFRAWEQPNLTVEECEALFPGRLPPKIMAKRNDKNAKICKVQGCYRDYSVKGETAWITFTTLNDELIVDGMSRKAGEGSAPLLVMRWDPDPCFSWGIGPAIKALPDYRSLDETEYLKLKGIARTIDPPVAFDDDSVINLDGGMPNGVAIPRMKGSQIDVIESKNGLQPAFFEVSDKEHTIRKHYYLDQPEQEGKTPPTLGQWADEAMRTQRRLGTPAAKLWPEFIAESFQRFTFLLKERGVLQDFSRNGKVIQLRPINPLKRAANQQKAVSGERFFNAVNATFAPGSVAELICKPGDTIRNMAELAGADGVELLDAVQIDANFKQRQQQMMMQGAAEAAGKAGVGPALAGAGQ